MCYTGGSSTKAEIYRTNKKQSTTHNAYGVYDMRGNSYEYTANYIKSDIDETGLLKYGGKEKGDLYGTDEEKNKSTKYKTIYNYDTGDRQNNFNITESKKGDAIYETSNNVSTWFLAYGAFPITDSPFFQRGGGYTSNADGIFYFVDAYGKNSDTTSFRIILIT